MVRTDLVFWVLIGVALAGAATIVLHAFIRSRSKTEDGWLDFTDEEGTSERFGDLGMAQFWFQLGNYTAAMGEVELLSPEQKQTLPAMKLRCRIYRLVADWERVADCASAATDLYSYEPFFWVCWAWAEHKLGRTESGLQVIAIAAEEFPNEEAVAYCYCCLFAAVKRVVEAREWLNRAMESSPSPENLRLRALAQPEFEHVWSEIVGKSLPAGVSRQ